MKREVSEFRVRSPWQVTVSVWRALFLREAVSRLFNHRTAWLWLFVEPMVHVVFLMFLYAFVRMRDVAGMDITLWLLVGIMAFYQFKRAWTQGMSAVAANRTLFNYRQVRPVDTVLVRAGLEGVLTLLIFIILLGLVSFYLDPIPGDPLLVIGVLAGMWLVGLGLGLCTSVPGELIPELGNLIKMTMTPVYLMSGVIFPLHDVPPPYRDWLLMNPLAHGVDLARGGFSPLYTMMPGVSLAYLYFCALSLIAFGLLLHVRFSTRLTTQ